MTLEPPEKNSPETNPHAQVARLRELLAIPERQRTDAQWDEIIGIEIEIGPRKLPGNQPQKVAQDGRRQQARRPSIKPAATGTYPRKHKPRRPA